MRRLLRSLFLVREIISREGLVHFRRYRLLETPWFAVYIHWIGRSDEDKHPHNHPWWFRSFILKGGYVEIVHNDRGIQASTFRPGSTVSRSTDEYHKIALLDRKPTWTLVLRGRRTNPRWGYLTEGGPVCHEMYRKMKHGGT